MYKGIIYKCTCLITNKIYIGQTIRNLTIRKEEHYKNSFNPNLIGYNYHFHRAIRKYGKENFKWEIIEQISVENLDNLYSILNNLEIKYIKLYDSYYNGYNSTEGGDSNTKVCKVIIAYEENGSIFAKYENHKDASVALHIPSYVIHLVCGRFRQYANTKFGRIVLRYEGDSYLESEISELKANNRNKKIYCYNLNGTLVNIFNSSKEIIDYYNLKYVGYVLKNCNKESAFVQCKDERLIFRYEGDDITKLDLERAKNIKSDCKKCVKAINAKTNKIIKVFRTMSDAAKFFNTQRGKVSLVCSGKRKTSGKYNGDPVRYEIISYLEYEQLR